MRKWLLIAWCMLPVGATAFHLGPGQDRMSLDHAAELVAEAHERFGRALALAEDKERLAATGELAKAERAFEEAIAMLPADRVSEIRALRVERAKCWMLMSKLPDANRDLLALVEELAQDDGEDPELVRDARRAFANSQYYMTWLMRLEGVGREEWEPRIESARQTYKLLVEEAEDAGEHEHVQQATEDLEAAIRLARMDLSELQGLPLPSQ